MPAKSRSQRSKQSGQSKKGKGGAKRPGVPAPSPVKTAMEKPASPAETTVPVAVAAAPLARPVSVSHAYVTKELRTIGILSVIMVAILIVLALVLPS